jgi:hypothetical protein
LNDPEALRGVTMSRKRVRWVVAVLLAFAVALTALWWFYLRPPYGITQRSFTKIQKGMTLEEVEKIIGVPPDRVEGMVQFVWEGPGFPEGAEDFETFEIWSKPDRQLRVFLDAKGIVLGKHYNGPDTQGFLSRLLDMLGL